MCVSQFRSACIDTVLQLIIWGSYVFVSSGGCWGCVEFWVRKGEREREREEEGGETGRQGATHLSGEFPEAAQRDGARHVAHRYFMGHLLQLQLLVLDKLGAAALNVELTCK